MAHSSFTVNIIGGSVAGLAAAAEMSRVSGAEVRVFEQSAGPLVGRGAGLVMQPEVEWLLRQHGQDPRDVTVPVTERRHLLRDGSYQTFAMPQRMTAWDTLYRAFRAMTHNVAHRQGASATALELTADQMRVTFEDGTVASSDLLIGADGVNSTIRPLLRDTPPTYSGYVAWRGLEDEQDLPGAIVAELAGRFSFYGAPGMQFLCYLVPGADGDTSPGRRRVNWAWAVNTAPDGLATVTTGASGRRYHAFLPADDLAADVRARLLALAGDSLPDLFARLVRLSQPFLHPILDVALGRMRAGRVLVAEDAAGTVRPHTASGTSKAVADSALLADVLRDWSAHDPLPEERLRRWERQRFSDLRRIAATGVGLADSLQLGTAGPPDVWDLAGNR